MNILAIMKKAIGERKNEKYTYESKNNFLVMRIFSSRGQDLECNINIYEHPFNSLQSAWNSKCHKQPIRTAVFSKTWRMRMGERVERGGVHGIRRICDIFVTHFFKMTF